MRNNHKSKFTAIVVDDEPLARKLLIASLEAHKDIEVIGECSNGREAVEFINRAAPDLMFLDIQMPGLGGFDVMRALSPENIPETIFVTAYDRYAIDAFDANAVDYLLKPISEERLARAVGRALLHLSKDDRPDGSKKKLYGALNKAVERVKGKQDVSQVDKQAPSAEVRKLSIKDGDSVVIVEEPDIDWIDAAGDYMCIHVQGHTHIMRSTMHELLKRLNPEKFKRIHRSTIVNIDRIIKIQKHTKGEYLLYLTCGEQTKVSRHYKSVIREFIDKQP